MTSTAHQRLAQLVSRVDKQDRHLMDVRQRFLGNDCAVDTNRLAILLADDTGIDRLESFGAKFARLQNSVVDKLIPSMLRQAGEPVAAAIDNLARMERLALVASADDWLRSRGLRNRLVHEYIDRPEDLAPAIEAACRLTTIMHQDYVAMRDYAVTRLGNGSSNDELIDGK